MTKPPKIIEIYKCGFRGGHPVWGVAITEHMFQKLPDWVQHHINRGYPENDKKHVGVLIDADDELQASQRFHQLWEALPKTEGDKK